MVLVSAKAAVTLSMSFVSGEIPAAMQTGSARLSDSSVAILVLFIVSRTYFSVFAAHYLCYRSERRR